MNHEERVVVFGIIFLIILLIVLNLLAFRSIESKILDSVEKKCTNSIRLINNITSLVPPPRVQTNPEREIEYEEEDEEEDDD